MLLKPSEGLKLAEELGIPVPPWGGPELGAPAYVKADAPIPHKSDLKAVVFAETQEELEEAYKRLSKRFGGAIVQKPVEGLELLVSSKEDRVFGKVLVLAAGGLYASLLKESLVTLCPFCKDVLEAKLSSRKLGRMLTFRRKLDLNCLFDVMRKLCDVKAKTFEINPLILGEEGCWAVDVKVWL